MPCPGMGHDLGTHHAGVLGLLHDANHEVQLRLHPSEAHLRHHAVTPILCALLVLWSVCEDLQPKCMSAPALACLLECEHSDERMSCLCRTCSLMLQSSTP